MPFTFRAARMIFSRCARFSTSTSTAPVALPSVLRSSMLRMFVPGSRDRGGDVGVQAAPVVPLERETHDEPLALRLLPVDLEPALRLVRQEQQVRTVGAVDAHAAAARHVAGHRIARHRLAALGVADHQPVDALDLHALRAAHALDQPLDERRLRAARSPRSPGRDA